MKDARYITVYRGQMVACNTIADLDALLANTTVAVAKTPAAKASRSADLSSVVTVKVPTTFYNGKGNPVDGDLAVAIDVKNVNKLKKLKLACVYDNNVKKWATPTVVSVGGNTLSIDESKSMAQHILGTSFHGRHRIDASTGPDVTANYTEANFR